MPHRTRSHLLSFKITMSQRGALSEIPRPQPKAMSCHLYVSSARWTNAHDSTAHKSRHMFLHWTQHSFEWSQCLSREVLNEFCKQTRQKKKQITQRCWFQYLALYSCCSACPCILVWLRIIMFQLPSERFCCAAWTPISYRKCPTNEAICSEFDKLNEDNEGKSWKIHRNPPWTKWESSAHQLARCLGLS